MTIRLVIVGCGGFGREVFSLVAAINRATSTPWVIEGFIDDAPSRVDQARVKALGSDILGPIDWLRDRGEVFSAVIAIGSPPVRRAVADGLDRWGMTYPQLVHPDATVGSSVRISHGVVIAAGARLSTNIQIGAHVQIDQNATIGHDTEVGDYSRLNPQSCVSGAVRIGVEVLIGANATILPNLSVGSGATVGAQACVVRDVPERTVVKGVPAR